MMTRLADLSPTSRSADTLLAHGRDGRFTWSDWVRAVAYLMPRIESHGGQRWALYCSNTFEFSVGLWALWACAKTPWVPPSNGAATVQLLRNRVDGFLGEFPSEAPLAVIARPSDVAGQPRQLLTSDAELVLFTSGSTGEPKPIRKSVAQLDAEIATLAGVWEQRVDGSTVLATVSHQHIYGLLFKLLWPMCAGRPYWAELVTDTTQLRTLTKLHAPCTWLSSPAFLKRTPQRAFDGVRGDDVRAVFSSGGPLPYGSAALVSNVIGEPPLEVYGSTETGGIGYRQQHSANAPWLIFPGVEIAVSGDDVMMVRSPHLDDRGWQASGDRGELLEEGRFQLGARADRVVKIEEKRISLTSIETAILRHTGVAACRCILLPGRRDVVAAAVVLNTAGYRAMHASGQAAFVSSLRRGLRDVVESGALPRRWRFVDALPSNDMGKLIHTDIARLFDSKPADRHPVPRVDSINENAVELSFVLDANGWFFAGHFPDAPVLPGALQLLWAIRFARQHLGVDGQWNGLEAIKFSSVIRPGDVVGLHLSMTAAGKLAFRYTANGRTSSAGRFTRD